MRRSTVAAVAADNRRPLAAALVTLAVIGGLLLPVGEARADGGDDYEKVVDLTFPLGKHADYWYKVGGDYHDWRVTGVRRHQATDIMADHGTHVHAVVGGKIRQMTGMGCGWSSSGDKDEPPSWGYAIYVDGDDGRTYVYIHLGRQDGPASKAYADGLTCGSRVERGQHIGYVGDSGSAGSPHLHFEIHDDDVKDPYDYHEEERIDPYLSLVKAEERGDYPGAEPIEVGKGAIPITGDWDGDGHETAGWYDDGRVHLRSRTGALKSFSYGTKGDLPIVGDWDGDGKDTLGVVRDGRWYLRNSNSSGVADLDFKYGRVLDGDYPLAGDWNGDGTDTVGIVRGGEWHLRKVNSGGPGQIVYTYGRVVHGDIPLMGDWTGDGKDTPAIVRGNEWHLRNVHRGGPADKVFKYGGAGDQPVAGDWNRSDQASPGIVRDQEWMLRNKTSGGVADLTFPF